MQRMQLFSEEKKKTREQKTGEKSAKKTGKGNLYQRAGYFLTKKLGLDKMGEKNRCLHQELTALASGNPRVVTDYYAKKLGDTLLVLTVFVLVLLAVIAFSHSGSREVKNNQLERPGYRGGSREEQLAVRIEGEAETELLTVTVQEQKYTKEQVENYLEAGRQVLEQQILGQNVSLDEVRTNLYFPDTLENGAVKVSWLTYPYGMIDDQGIITGEPEDAGSIVEIQAVLSCQEQELVYETAVCVYPPILTEKEQFLKKLKETIIQTDKKEAHLEVLSLPEEMEGKILVWLEPGENLVPLFLILTVIMPLCVYIQKDQKIHEKAKARKLQLELDYSEVMWKMTMLMGAGLTIRGAFTRIAMEYKKENQGPPRYVYEEMLYTCHEMKSGISESMAYESFGRRCDLPKYIKLGCLLSQNLKKGSKGLVSLLEKESVSSLEERKNLARKLGEQAGTKLMFPMILMFAVVLIILVVPAFLSF